MLKKKLTRIFFTQPTLKVAKDLLGKYLIRQFGRKKIIGRIVETEAYLGPQDKASHAYGGKKTKRNLAEYLIGGHLYIYLVYGMHWQLNISTAQAGKPECVLIRALAPVINRNPKSEILSASWRTKQTQNSCLSAGGANLKIRNLTNGPGKLCCFLKLNKSFYGEDLTKSKRIWLEDWGTKIKKEEIVATKRIGIDYAGKYWAGRKWRFYLKNNIFVSKISLK